MLKNASQAHQTSETLFKAFLIKNEASRAFQIMKIALKRASDTPVASKRGTGVPEFQNCFFDVFDRNLGFSIPKIY